MKKRDISLLLDKLLDPVGASLNVEAASKLLNITADRPTQRRVAVLADRCNEGKLTVDERHEYEQFVMVSHFLAVLQAKARILLARAGRTV